MEGHAEFLARCLEEYQRSLRTMHGRVTESAQENQLTQDLEHLNYKVVSLIFCHFWRSIALCLFGVRCLIYSILNVQSLN